MEQPCSPPTFFLGTNAPGAFLSHFQALLEPRTARKLYILKGGPGCGKSTLMRRFGQSFAKAGHPVVQIPCSSDPNSLDAVLIPDLGIAIADGTAPHAMAPKGHFFLPPFKKINLQPCLFLLYYWS